MGSFSLLLLVCACILDTSLTADWTYSREAIWGDTYPDCNGDSQSPINIYEGEVNPEPANLQGFNLANYGVADLLWSAENSGYSVTFGLTDSTVVTASGGGLTDTYRVAQFHFHWGSTADQGSEHEISSHAFPMELHIVHYNMKYNDINEAVTKSDGLAVLGFMYEISATDNPNYATLVSTLSNIVAADSSVSVSLPALQDLLGPNLDEYFRYQGSLTTPACNEVVTWTVFKHPIKISAAQLNAFRALESTDGTQMVDNYRPVQELNDRIVRSSFDPHVHWGYILDGANHWPNYYSTCGRDSQSPIDIPSGSSEYDQTIAGMEFNNYGKDDQGFSMTLSNNGHAAVVTYGGEPGITISAGGLPETYVAAQFHLHWGSMNTQGSEHLVDGVAYPAELHIVHFRQSLGSLATAATVDQGLAVLGFFLHLTNEDNPALDHIIDNLVSVTEPDTTHNLPLFSLDSILPAEREHFFRYSGSLTTPGCYESVIWTVFESTIGISASQLEKLRMMKSSETVNGEHVYLEDNFRPPQPINGRVIRRSFTSVAPHWTYVGDHGVDHWGDNYPYCANTYESKQSPINIVNRNAQFAEWDNDMRLSGYDQPAQFNLINDGHTVVAAVLSGDMRISGGGLNEEYRAAQFHFHWGSDSGHGSEHQVDGLSYGLELHIVHYADSYAAIGDAVDKRNGLAVLGFMFEIVGTNNSLLDPIISQLPNIRQVDSSVSIDAMVVRDLLPSSLDDFYRYSGSLTTPACYESVVWTVFRVPILISEQQLQMFREVLSSDVDPASGEHLPMVNNYRPPQPLNGRVVYANFKLDPDSAAGVKASLILCLCGLLAALLTKAF